MILTVALVWPLVCNFMVDESCGQKRVKVKCSGLAVFPLTLTGHNFFIKNNFLVLFEDLKRA